MLIKKYLLIFLVCLIIIFLALIFSYSRAINSPESNSKSLINFTVTKGEPVKRISENLFQAGLIKSKFYFEFYIWLNHKQASLQAGEYELSPSQNIKQIVSILGNGKERNVKILIKEGEGEGEIAQTLEQNGLTSANDFLAVTGRPMLDYSKNNNSITTRKDFSVDYDFLSDKPKYYSLEGYLFPDTYQFSKNDTPEKITKKMLANFDSKLTPDLRSAIKNQSKSIYEIITMASVLEKEVKTFDDMKIVSGIFWQRIANGQPLQSDATLSYALNDTTASHSLTDLQIDSPYNSYRYKGLPPTPIGNPGINAIIASINPVNTDYNFFLTSSDGSKTVFAKTFAEHIKNKQKYLK